MTIKKPVTTISRGGHGMTIDRDPDKHGVHGKYGETGFPGDEDLIDGGYDE